MADINLFAGETHEVYSFTWTVNGSALNLTGATVTVHFTPEPAGGTGFAGAGTLTVTNAASGTLTYAFATSDVASAGQWTMQFKAVFGDATVEYSRPITIVISSTY